MPAFEWILPVRFADVDHAGIVYYPRYFHYFHLAFEELWRDRIGARAYVDLLDKDRVGFPAVHADCDYKSPLRFGDIAVVALSIRKMGTTSIHFHYQVSKERESFDAPRTLCAVGNVITAVVDLSTFTKTTPPARISSLLADLVETS